ncbi:MAG: hypothetical protein II932_01515, partial [Treponema sp.]|nr:hypothetical protein [Treponema sp.]
MTFRRRSASSRSSTHSAPGGAGSIPQINRINALLDRRIINSLLAKSFNRLRKIGNEAVHKEYVIPEKLAPVAGKKFVVRVKRHDELTGAQQAEEAAEDTLITQARTAAAAAPKVHPDLRRNRSLRASRARPLTEAETRELIDEQLRAVGWEAERLKPERRGQRLPVKGKNALPPVLDSRDFFV